MSAAADPDDILDILDISDAEDERKTDAETAETIGNSDTELGCDGDDLVRKLNSQLKQLETVRKDRVFEDELTLDETALMQKRIALQQQQFKAFEEREFRQKSQKILAVYESLNAEEIKTALKECHNDEDLVILNMTEPEFAARIKSGGAIEPHISSFIDFDDSETSPVSKKNRKSDSTVYKKSIYSIDAIAEPDANPSEIFKGWSQARVNAYKAIEHNPNRYFYRFNAPGEMQKNGAWTQDEKRLFMDRMAEVGVDGQWGIFSRAIPGRVGYQCATLYRTLIRNGTIKDANYAIGSKGNLKYLGYSRANRKHDGSSQFQKMRIRNITADDNKLESENKVGLDRRRKIIAETTACHHGDSTIDYSRLDNTNDNNSANDSVLPGFIDPITLEQVVKPAISPYGHVMGYDTWISCLKSKLCPFTKKPLSRRDLMILTFENVDEYRDKIVNK